MTARLTTRYTLLLFPLMMLLSGCADQPQAKARADVVAVSADSSAPDAASEESAQQQEFEERLLGIAREYGSFVPIDPDAFRWANVDCAPPSSEWAMSASSDLATHGRKLYRLFAKLQSRPGTYIEDSGLNPVGQVLVKESWVPENERPNELSALFIMFKLNPATPGTDEGWVYGTVTADGKKVTSAGRVASCMSCHIEAPHDRLFGPHLPAE